MACHPARTAAATLALALLAACGGSSSPPPPPPIIPVGDGVTAWQFFGPSDYSGNALTVAYPNLLSTERLAVLLVNAGGTDRSSASVTAAGTGSPALSLAGPAPLQAMAGVTETLTGTGVTIDRTGIMAGEAMVSALREETIARLRDGRLPRVEPGRPAEGRLLATAAAAALPTTRSFCQGQYSGTGTFTQVWKPATLQYQTAHAAYYATNEVQPGIDLALASRPDFFTSLGDAYETRILPALTTYFGPESDVDQNGKVIFLFANLGKTTGGSFPVGYFWPGDIEAPLANATTCLDNKHGNFADMLYLIDPGNFTANWGGTGANYDAVLNLILGGEYQSTMAHELQHDVNYNTRFPPGGAWGIDEELWLNEGLSMLSETVAGYGLHTATGRANVRTYQGRADAVSPPYYQGYGMTIWTGDPYGNYAGVQAYMQYLLDHATPAMTRALENKTLAGKANIEAATGVAWELGFARFATAAMFSNEDASAYAGGLVTSHGNLLADPLLNYLGDLVSPDYVPWHHYTGSCSTGGVVTPKPRDANVAWTPLSPGSTAALRTDGWAAFATGPGANGPATITVQSSAAVRPRVVVVKYGGRMPDYAPPTCP